MTVLQFIIGITAAYLLIEILRISIRWVLYKRITARYEQISSSLTSEAIYRHAKKLRFLMIIAGPEYLFREHLNEEIKVLEDAVKENLDKILEEEQLEKNEEEDE